MANEKHYTPSIEEFHVGFEYEQYVMADFDEATEVGWLKRVIGVDDFIDSTIADIQNAFENSDNMAYRVKILDQQDMETTGWKQIEPDEYERYTMSIAAEFGGARVLARVHPSTSPPVVVIRSWHGVNWNYMFHGTIKNKSELKRLMKQLNINPMNIRTIAAGSVTDEHIKSRGFVVFETIEGNDMGQMEYSIPQYTNGKVKIVGGYWTWYVKDMEGKTLWEGWWNSNDEFDETMKQLNINI